MDQIENHKDNRQKIINKLENYQQFKQVFIFNNYKIVDNFVKSINIQK